MRFAYIERHVWLKIRTKLKPALHTQCMALLGEQKHCASHRALFLSGAVYSVVQQGMRGLPCVTATAAHVAATLADDDANADNILEQGSPLLAFITFLTSLGDSGEHAHAPPNTSSTDADTTDAAPAAPPIAVEFVGTFRAPRDQPHSMPGERVRLECVCQEDLTAKLTSLIYIIRAMGESEGYFALQDYDEFVASVGPTPHHERYGKCDGAARRVPPVDLAESASGLVGRVVQVGYSEQLAVYHIKGVTEIPAEGGVGARTGGAGGADVKPGEGSGAEKAWGPVGAAIYKTSQELDVMTWERDDVLIVKARNLGLLSLVRLAQHCSSVEVLGKFVACGALDLLLSLARAQPPLDDTGLSCVTHAIFLFAKATHVFVLGGASCPLGREDRLAELRAVAKALLLSPNDEIQADAASALLTLNAIENALIATADLAANPPQHPTALKLEPDPLPEAPDPDVFCHALDSGARAAPPPPLSTSSRQTSFSSPAGGDSLSSREGREGREGGQRCWVQDSHDDDFAHSGSSGGAMSAGDQRSFDGIYSPVTPSSSGTSSNNPLKRRDSCIILSSNLQHDSATAAAPPGLLRHLSMSQNIAEGSR